MSAGAGGSRRCPAGPRHGPRAPVRGAGGGWGGRRERPRGRGAPAGPRPRPPSPLRPLRRVSCRYIRRGAVGRGVPSGEAGPGVGGGDRPNPPGAAPPRPPVGGGCSAGCSLPRRERGGGARREPTRPYARLAARWRGAAGLLAPLSPCVGRGGGGLAEPHGDRHRWLGVPPSHRPVPRAPCSWGRGDLAEAYGLPKHRPYPNKPQTSHRGENWSVARLRVSPLVKPGWESGEPSAPVRLA